MLESGGSLVSAALLDFVDSGQDLILAADGNVFGLIRNIAAECGVDFDEAQLNSSCTSRVHRSGVLKAGTSTKFAEVDKDLVANKVTYPKLNGIEESKEFAAELNKEAQS
ncbi:hypothetical protein DM860_004864 [Cuscuta australis]|uniref:Uncharacterized protein n=1 Tax=Cuscuta australis TaxID=267555 RepID=A0A328DLN4_9ASTE|nr:hypothetical protein DM860_004864 [Cuscuta australis]